MWYEKYSFSDYKCNNWSIDTCYRNDSRWTGEPKHEINSNLPAAVEQTVANLVERKYTIDDRNEYLADFMEDLSAGLDTESDIKVEITNVDLEKRMMGIKVTETFYHPNGRGISDVERTVNSGSE